MQYSEPIKKLDIRFQRFTDGYSEMHVRVGDKGELVLDACDAGQHIKERMGDWDYEYWVTVPAAYKDSVLLHAIKALGFDDVTPFSEWCAARGIPAQFSFYT
jgi:hypothetical protein